MRTAALVVASGWLIAAGAARVARAQEAAQPEAPAAAAATGTHAPCAGNLPPVVAERLTVLRAHGAEAPDSILRIGRTTRLALVAHDPEGDALTFEAPPLPAGASLDATRGVLTWRPTSEQAGTHSIVLVASDGRSVTARTFVLHVHENHAPVRNESQPVAFVIAGQDGTADAAYEPPTVAWDADYDPLSVRARVLPAGARLTAGSGHVKLAWQPGEDAIGEHVIEFDVSDGLAATSLRVKVLVIPKWARRDYTGWLLLGGGASAYVPQASGELLVGGVVDVSLVALREAATQSYACGQGTRQNDCHASLHRFYAQLEVLDSLRSGQASMFVYGVGYSASFEWYPGRRWLIPHYGVELGGLVREGDGHLAQTRPYLGMHLWASDQLWVNAVLGYRIVPAALSDLSGPTFALTLVSSPW